MVGAMAPMRAFFSAHLVVVYRIAGHIHGPLQAATACAGPDFRTVAPMLDHVARARDPGREARLFLCDRNGEAFMFHDGRFSGHIAPVAARHRATGAAGWPAVLPGSSCARGAWLFSEP